MQSNVKLKTYTVILVLLIVPVLKCSSQLIPGDTDNQKTIAFFRFVYIFSFKQADSLLNNLSENGIDELTESRFRAYLEWWKILSGDEINSNMGSCIKNLDKSIRLEMKDKNIGLYNQLGLIYSYSLRSRLENYRGNVLLSLMYFYKDLSAIRNIVDQTSLNNDLYLPVGLYLYFLDFFKNKNGLSRSLFFNFPEGDKRKGLEILKRCSSSSNEIISTEADYFLMKLYSTAEKDYETALIYSNNLTQKYPGNFIFSLERLQLLKILNDNKYLTLKSELQNEIKLNHLISEQQRCHLLLQLGKI